MANREIGIIMHGATGRMGLNQHLVRSILAIRDQGGITLSDGQRLIPKPVLVGRNADKIARLAAQYQIADFGTDIDAALARPDCEIFFDAATTQMRAGLIERAIAAGKHIYCEKPVAENTEQAQQLVRLANAAGIKTGVVHDKLYMPGLLKLRMLRDSGFFGRILSAKIDFGYWVFEGDWQPAQRPSWNYRKRDGGGIIIDMMPHWRYVVDNVIAPVRSVSCYGKTHIASRVDEADRPYQADADDAAYAMLECDDDVLVQIAFSWCTRVRRDDLVTFQIDGTLGSAVAGLSDCYTQARVNTPRPVWNPDERQSHDFRGDWQLVPENRTYDNGFKTQWEQFLRHVAEDTAYDYDLAAGVKGVQLAEAATQSWRERRWVDLPVAAD
ncbi:MAG: Gfo/Idh/MocA family protein [Alphaproteobacteria bacterium]